MLYFFIKTDSTWANVSDDVVWDSLKIQENLGEQSNTADFRMIDVRPISGQEVSVYDGTKLTTARTPVGRTLSVEDAYTDANKFRAGDRVWLDPRGAKEEFATVSVASDNRIILTANTQNTHSVGVIVAKKKFAGHILRTPDTNIRQIDDVEVAVQCVDYTREFSRKLINEGWTNSNALTIIRDMLRDTINGGLTAPFTASVDDVDIGTTFSVFKAPFKNAMSVMQRLADELGDYHWYIDYDRRVHFGSLAKEPAPISIDRNGQSFANLGINVDLSQLKISRSFSADMSFRGLRLRKLKPPIPRCASGFCVTSSKTLPCTPRRIQRVFGRPNRFCLTSFLTKRTRTIFPIFKDSRFEPLNKR
jgi:hypothetical protein